MCGIFALLNTDESIVSLKEISFMCNEAKHRGPESSQIQMETNPNFLFGFHRLAINGLDTKSNQPFNLDDCMLICNGEIYNYKELYKKLGVKNSTNSDCEIIIHLYRKYGMLNTLQMLDGVFAFVLFDKNENAMYVARDPFGVRPLFEAESSMYQIYAFGSELKQVYPLKYVSDVSINAFSPGSYKKYVLNKETNKFHVESKHLYVSFGFSKLDVKPIDEWQTYYDIIKNGFEKAVKKRVENTDRPVACLLSGGLDSSLVASIVKKYYNGSSKLETYSIGLEGAEDLKYAKQVAQFLDTNHTELVVTESEFFNAIPEVIEKIESYDTTTVRASVGNYLIGKYISKHSEAKVIFNGDGSDELAGGYLYMHLAPNATEFDLECKRLLRDIHYFDVLRSDRSMSTNGLEPRTPFLDRGWVEQYLSIPEEVRCHNLHKLPEKYLIRKAFEKGEYLPENILWRTKEAFSDGVSSVNRSWFEIINENLLNNTDLLIAKKNKELTLEQNYYKNIFNSYYSGCEAIIPYYWMPRFIDADDASARTLKIYNETSLI